MGTAFKLVADAMGPHIGSISSKVQQIRLKEQQVHKQTICIAQSIVELTQQLQGAQCQHRACAEDFERQQAIQSE